MSKHTPTDTSPKPPDLYDYVPYPFYQVKVPTSDRDLCDNLKPLLEQCHGLAMACYLALAHHETSDQRDAITDALFVLSEYLRTAKEIFGYWEQAH